VAITPTDNDTIGRIPHFVLEPISWETNDADGRRHDRQRLMMAVEEAEERLVWKEVMGINWWRSSINCWVAYIPSPTITPHIHLSPTPFPCFRFITPIC